MTHQIIEIVTTAHWKGDPRLNRHVGYLTDAGHSATLTSLEGSGRISATWRGMVAIARSKADIVLIPDPEMFLLGGLAARVSGKLPVIDIHEDYGKAAMSRAWVPAWARWLIGTIANLAVWCGRVAAWRVLAAAGELRRPGDFLVLNIPDPSSLSISDYDGSRRLVYVGDVTEARGAAAMVQVLAALDDSFDLLIVGNVGVDTAEAVLEMAQELDVANRIEMTGRMEHHEAWQMAGGALAGLNLLEPVPAYQMAVATKLWEYMAIGVPPIVSNLPGHARIVGQIDPNLVCGSLEEAAAVAAALASNPSHRKRLAETGRLLLEHMWAESRPDLAIQEAVAP